VSFAVSDSALSWFRSHLTDRELHVLIVNGSVGQWVTLSAEYLADHSVTRPIVFQLHSIYFQTNDQTPRSAIALFRRRRPDERFSQTIGGRAAAVPVLGVGTSAAELGKDQDHTVQHQPPALSAARRSSPSQR
jgi:hypothetical protein